MPRGLNPHPVDNAIADLAAAKRAVLEDFLADDGIVCAKEQEILTLLNSAHGAVAHDRRLERLKSHLERLQPGECSRYTVERFQEAGYSIAPLDPEPTAA